MPARINQYNLTVQSGMIDDLTSGIKNFVVNNFDTAHPVKAILTEFFIPGFLMTVSAPLGIAYELAGALGFVDWRAFWDSVIDPLENVVSTSKSSGVKPSDEVLEQQIQEILNKAADTSFKDNGSSQPTDSQVKELEKAQQALRNQDNPEATALARSIRQSLLIKYASINKTAGWASSIFRTLFTFLLPKIKWVAGKVVKGLLMTTVAGAVATLTGNPQAQPGGSAAAKENDGSDNSQSNIANFIPISKSVPQELYIDHDNSIGSVWMEDGNVEDTPATLMDWITAAYPQLKKYEDDIEGSSAFRSVVNQLVQRNKFSKGTGYIIIPHPYERKIDIVANVVSKFISEHINSLA